MISSPGRYATASVLNVRAGAADGGAAAGLVGALQYSSSTDMQGGDRRVRSSDEREHPGPSFDGRKERDPTTHLAGVARALLELLLVGPRHLGRLGDRCAALVVHVQLKCAGAMGYDIDGEDEGGVEGWALLHIVLYAHVMCDMTYPRPVT